MRVLLGAGPLADVVYLSIHFKGAAPGAATGDSPSSILSTFSVMETVLWRRVTALSLTTGQQVLYAWVSSRQETGEASTRIIKNILLVHGLGMHSAGDHLAVGSGHISQLACDST